MASVPVANLSAAEKEQLAVSYASFVLSGSGAQVNAESLSSVLKASGINVSAGLLNAVAKALKGRNVTEFFGGVSVAGGSSSSSASSAPQPAQSKPAEKQAPKV
jgi:ribosomal protein L12E/L44/L45/RPP1/RPP2